MRMELSQLYTGIKQQMMREEGQDLTQVVLVVALVAVGATAGMNSVASAVGSAFTSLSGFVLSTGGGVVIH